MKEKWVMYPRTTNNTDWHFAYSFSNDGPQQFNVPVISLLVSAEMVDQVASPYSPLAKWGSL